MFLYCFNFVFYNHYKFFCHGEKTIKSVNVFFLPTSGLFFFFFYKFIYLFIFGCVGSCCTRAFSSCGELGLLFVEVRRFLTAVASLVAEHGL